VILAIVLSAVGTTTASEATYTYDAPVLVPADAYRTETGAGASRHLAGRLERSASRSAETRSTSTTSRSQSVATNKADDFANWGGEFVDDAVRAPATRPDFANISAKIERQMQTRGWTPDLIDEAVTSGNKFPAVNKLGGANTPATRYVSPTTGQSAVIDNATGEIIQVGGPGFKYGP
jgi:hypothetical protein